MGGSQGRSRSRAGRFRRPGILAGQQLGRHLQGQAIPPINETFTPGVGLITCLAETDTPPAGYTLTSMIAAICKDGDPSPVLVTATLANEVLVEPYSVEFTDLDTVPYQCAMWCEWTRTKDSKIHYSTAVRGQATPT
ncbi:unnamed protein product [marine sediment metagenome]|uniref:Uncharacterized protein n=1 Tax=marine sediment metagenome TaxID=412755 RepID=X1RDH3_9ZZZZ